MAKVKAEKELYFDTTDGNYYVLNPDGTYDPATADGAVLVTEGPNGGKHNRAMAAANTTYAASTNRRTWLESENVRAVIVTVTPATAAALQGDEYARIAWDAPDSGIGGGWLAVTDGNVRWDKMFPGQSRKFSFLFPLIAVDVLPIGDNMQVTVEAIDNDA